MIYLDYAATSYPKPVQVIQAIEHYMEQVGGNPGRSGHRLSIEAACIMYETREIIAGLFSALDPLRVIFTLNATHAINYVLNGLLKPGDEVVTTSIEHNSVMRPLWALEKKGIKIKIIKCNSDSSINLADVSEALANCHPRLVVINHASNVTGTILPVAHISEIAKRRGALVFVDVAQTAGVVPINIKAMGIDILAFTGHKGLMGPTGNGGLVFNDYFDTKMLEPIIFGGTGSNSKFERQPDDLPDKYESGTPNIAGIAGLKAGIEWINLKTVEFIREHEIKIRNALIEGLSHIPNITIYGARNSQDSTATLSFTLKDKDVSDIGLKLDEEFEIFCRVGLHCSPSAHKTIGTFPHGTVRLAPGIFTTIEDVEKTIAAIKRISQS